MAKNDTYSVHSRGKKQLRHPTAETPGEEFAVTKFDRLGCEVIVYFVTVSQFGAECSCPASSRPTCRHREMVRIFYDADRLSTNWRYKFDEKIAAKKWIKP